MGVPGCPELACWTPSIARVRLVFMHNWSSLASGVFPSSDISAWLICSRSFSMTYLRRVVKEPTGPRLKIGPADKRQEPPCRFKPGEYLERARLFRLLNSLRKFALRLEPVLLRIAIRTASLEVDMIRAGCYLFLRRRGIWRFTRLLNVCGRDVWLGFALCCL